MVDIQRRAVLRSLAKAATTASSGAHSPHMYHHQVTKPTAATTPLSAMDSLGVDVSAVDASDAAFFSALGSPAAAATSSSSVSTSCATTTMASSSMQSPYAFHNHGLLAMHHGEDDDNLFAAYAAEPQQHQELDDALRNNAWDLYYPPAQVPQTQAPVAVPSAPFPTPVTPSSDASMSSSSSASSPSVSNVGRGAAGSRLITNTRATGVRQGVKRPLERMSSSAATVPPVPMPSPVGSVVSSMLAMRATSATPAMAASASTTATGSATSSPATTARARPATGRRTKKETDAAASAAATAAAAADGMSSGSEDNDLPAAKKTKVSRERQLKINAASRRCRKKQKLELQFLRTHVVDLQSALKDQVGVLRATGSHHARVAKLATFLEESIRQVEDMSSGGRPGTPKASLYSENELHQLKATATQALAAAAAAAAAPPPPPAPAAPASATASESTQTQTRGESCNVRAIDPLTGYASLSADRRQTLLNIASFMRNNISLESQSFSPEVISCLPIEMDGWQLRLAITEKNYTIHNCKFFPCKVEDMYDFCWDTNVASKVSIKQGKNDYCVVTPLDTDVAHVYSKTIGKWSLSVHGVANVSYNSLVCRSFNQDTRRAMICQQSVLEDRDFQDESTIPWLFKRWVVFQPRVVDGVEGCFVEAYRTASYATGRLIYKEDNTYDSFCEHLIRRYAESNSLLERMMARDDRFQHLTTPSDALLALDHEETTSDRMVKDLLLF